PSKSSPSALTTASSSYITRFSLCSPGAPSLEVPSDEVVVVEGEKLHLVVPYKAIPIPKLMWQKEEAELKPDDRLSVTVEMNDAHLELLKSTRADGGKYTINLENTLGKASGAVTVRVIDFSPQFVYLIFAHFIILICSPPEVKWTKDGADTDAERVQIETEGKNTTLFIKVSARSDHGIYTVTGTNAGGTKSAETHVDVMGECGGTGALLLFSKRTNHHDLD
uniref:Immunoglobulin domain-containing protein n=1 Tax=Neogobius melanostomus TaxID=47308 RepID=A0A8C6UZF2_9GOBI